MVDLPTELLLMILDIVIAEGIIHCDPTAFPYIQASLISTKYDRQFYSFYYQLRLVCRRFNTLLDDDPPWLIFINHSLPFPIITRAIFLHLESISKRSFQRFLGETFLCGRLVHLDVPYGSIPSPDQPNLSDFLCAGPVFHNLQRLTLRPQDGPYRLEVSTWARLNRAFPLLTTFVISTQSWNRAELFLSEEGDGVVCFERLETLYLSGHVTCLGCHFPRLRNASICNCSQSDLDVFIRSPHLETLLIRSDWSGGNIDISALSRLKLLGFPHSPSAGVVPVGRDHPVEHIWLYTFHGLGDPRLIGRLFEILPKISRITVLLSPWEITGYHNNIIEGFRGMKLDSFGLTRRPIALDDEYLIIERATV